jgi:mannan endo-1,4-beta-mannosidase
LNVVRAFAFGTTEGFGLQTKPGEYNEAAFKALDTVIDEAGKRGLRLILAIANNWVAACSTAARFASFSRTSPRSVLWAIESPLSFATTG